MTLTDFLLARIAEDEADGYCHTDCCDAVITDCYACNCDGVERVLAECEAKRRIVEDFEEYARDCRDAPSEFAAGRRHAALLAATRLAAIYADHPDFDAAWRP